MDQTRFVLYKSNMTRRLPHPASIRTYNLFGEAGDLPDVVHCETIAARSQLHEWEFAPHRHARLHQILLVEKGNGQATLDGRAHPLKAMRAVNVPSGHVHGFSFTPGMQGFVLTIAVEMLDEALTPAEGLRRALADSTVIRASTQMRDLMRQIYKEYSARHFARAHMLRALSAALLGLVARELADESTTHSAGSTDLFRRFETLLERHFLDHWSVADYAKALSITATHLSRLTKAATGHAASELIQERLVREARRNLVYTNLSVSTIAYELGFNDPAYFSRVFAGATGLSPRSFREKVVKGG
ncbi:MULTISPECIES: helix-turn-helix domain-containing protein [unclassified Bradyrhizobium]|uniref:helix-turn-helix domain-containing protein n=1 Tax=unclassified Bradyrhizobium TaxID=2631580 RepID=UPI00291610D3|nr:MULTISPECIES: helix-turn-helix domain-containing protein [unclassified Bradyrhizobium]